MFLPQFTFLGPCWEWWFTAVTNSCFQNAIVYSRAFIKFYTGWGNLKLERAGWGESCSHGDVHGARRPGGLDGYGRRGAFQPTREGSHPSSFWKSIMKGESKDQWLPYVMGKERPAKDHCGWIWRLRNSMEREGSTFNGFHEGPTSAMTFWSKTCRLLALQS